MRVYLMGLLLALIATAPTMATVLAPAADVALQQVLERGKQTGSDAVVVWQDGREIGHYYRGDHAPGPIELMSVTKSVVALGLGQLLDQGKLRSLDQPVADFYPQWRQGRKRAITVRMLMNHTSGLQNVARTSVEIYPAPDAIELALAAELSSAPGATASYNNKAVNLLAGIIEKASGQPMDGFFRDGLFKAMDIHPGPWAKDAAGHPYAMAGLALTATDLAKLGELANHRGRWNGQQRVSAAYIDAMLAAGPLENGAGGLLWWRTPQWQRFDIDPASFAMLRQRGVPEAVVQRVQAALRGAHYDSPSALRTGITQALGSDAPDIMRQLVRRGIGPYQLFKIDQGPIVAYNGNGDGGQYLVIVPKAHLVAVRQIAVDDDSERADQDYGDFVDRVVALAAATGAFAQPAGTRAH